MRLELTRVGLLAEIANHYTTRGASGKKALPMVVYLFKNSIMQLKSSSI